MKMKYTKEMFLQSATGYCMPYSADECEPVPTLGYGEQVHPQTKEKFFHHGMDLTANGATLLAVASGTVTGLGSDPIHEGYVKIRYGNYEVEYGHVTEIYVGFGMEVAAGQQVAKSGNILHIGIRFDGEEIDPADFLAMLYQNCMSSGMVGDGNTGIEVPSAYAKDMDEIASLMSRYLPLYMDELRKGSYRPSEQTEKASDRSVPLASKVQDLIIGDFLNYLAVRHSVFLSTWDESQKKKFLEAATDDIRYIDPLQNLKIIVRSFDVPRIASVYPDNAGIRWWTKAWFNNREHGEDVIEISREMAIKFIQGEIGKDAWLERYYPKQMSIYHNAIEMTRKQLLGL